MSFRDRIAGSMVVEVFGPNKGLNSTAGARLIKRLGLASAIAGVAFFAAGVDGVIDQLGKERVAKLKHDYQQVVSSGFDAVLGAEPGNEPVATRSPNGSSH